MEIYSLIYLITSIVVVIFLAWRCVVLTKALAAYHILITEVINDKLTQDNIKLIASRMYGMTTEEFERRMKNGN